MADDRYKGAADAAVEEAVTAQKEANEKKRFANMLAQRAGMDAPFSDIEEPTDNATSATNAIRSDQFGNYTYPSEAARAFLTFRGQSKGAADIESIFDALQKGGFSWGSSKNDPKGGLRIALGKDGLVRRLANGTYGLWSWYPNAKKPADKKKGTGASSAEADDEDDDVAEGDAPAPTGEVAS